MLLHWVYFSSVKRTKLITVFSRAFLFFIGSAALAQSEVSLSELQITEDSSSKGLYLNVPTNSRWENLKIDSSLYESPFKVSLFDPKNGEDQQRLWSQTKSIFGYTLGIAGVSVLYNGKDEESNLLEKWSDNVSSIAVWDRDIWYINYLGHPYFGGVFYQTARKSGYRQWDAFFYTFMMSTFYWEYGIEAFAEEPSLQDLVLTPVLGWVYGEWAFNKERQIRNSGGQVAGSKLLGNTTLFFLDPVDSLGSWINNRFGRQVITAGTGSFFYGEVPLGDVNSGEKETQLKLNFQYNLGSAGETESRQYFQSNEVDPVDFGIVGVTIGGGHISLDEAWNFEDGSMPEWSLGLYFTPRISARLKYARTRLRDNVSGEKTHYENYSIDTQFYFNPEGKTRPYLTVGVGEEMFDKTVYRKNVIWNIGVGLHRKLTNNWAIQADWTNFYSPNKHTYENSITARIVYRFGKGEWFSQ